MRAVRPKKSGEKKEKEKEKKTACHQRTQLTGQLQTTILLMARPTQAMVAACTPVSPPMAGHSRGSLRTYSKNRTLSPATAGQLLAAALPVRVFYQPVLPVPSRAASTWYLPLTRSTTARSADDIAFFIQASLEYINQYPSISATTNHG